MSDRRWTREHDRVVWHWSPDEGPDMACGLVIPGSPLVGGKPTGPACRECTDAHAAAACLGMGDDPGPALRALARLERALPAGQPQLDVAKIRRALTVRGKLLGVVEEVGRVERTVPTREGNLLQLVCGEVRIRFRVDRAEEICALVGRSVSVRWDT